MLATLSPASGASLPAEVLVEGVERPAGLAVDEAGNLLVVEGLYTDRARVLRFPGPALAGPLPVHRARAEVLFATPFGIAGLTALPRGGGIAFTKAWAGTVLRAGVGSAPAPIAVGFGTLGGLVVLGPDRFVVLDFTRLYAFSPSPDGGPVGADRLSPFVRLPAPAFALAADGQGGLFVAEAMSARARLFRVGLEGTVRQEAEGLDHPLALARDSTGAPLIAERHRVVRVRGDGSLEPLVTGLTVAAGLALDGQGRLLVSDSWRDRVLRVPLPERSR